MKHCYFCDKKNKRSNKFCNLQCYNANKLSLNVVVTCQECGNDFKLTANKAKNRKFCSRKCRNLADRTGRLHVCFICNKEFYVANCLIGKYCSNECRYLGSRKQIIINCIDCNKEIKTFPSYVGKRIKRCSECSDKNKIVSFLGSKNPNWNGGTSYEPYDNKFNRKFKKAIKMRENNYCFNCDKYSKVLAVHHIDYNKKNTVKDNCVALCDSCHGKTNFDRVYWQKYLYQKLMVKLVENKNKELS